MTITLQTKTFRDISEDHNFESPAVKNVETIRVASFPVIDYMNEGEIPKVGAKIAAVNGAMLDQVLANQAVIMKAIQQINTGKKAE